MIRLDYCLGQTLIVISMAENFNFCHSIADVDSTILFLFLFLDIYEQLKFNLYQDDAVTGKIYFP